MGRFINAIVAGDYLITESNKPRVLAELRNCLDKLEIEQKLVIQLRFWENLEIAQIAIVMTTTWDHVNELLEKSLQQLREMMISSLNYKLTAHAA